MGYRKAHVRKQESTKKEGAPQLVVKGWEWVGETKKEQDWTGLGMTSEGSRIVGVVVQVLLYQSMVIRLQKHILNNLQ